VRYRVRHRTAYAYGKPVLLCHNEARLQPRRTPNQQPSQSTVSIDPPPEQRVERDDLFGNRVLYFAVQEAHDHLSVTALSEVEVEPRHPLMPAATPAWQTVRERLDTARGSAAVKPPAERDEDLLARHCLLDSACAAASPAAAAYAAPSFPPGRPLLEAVHDLNNRIYREFHFDPDSTTVVTPVADVLAQRHGVCQDFAHLAIACLRSLGLPARYVSGYLETTPPPGAERLQGADASHAWFAVFVPGVGWVDFDPTNDCLPGERHVTTAWGRDYADVTPLKGVIFGGGTHTLEVSVDVVRLVPPP
jgi:transglutaminase-like putative cysteine protease